jgi:uncharacterized membrane protein YkvA (DUF1232 family)
MVPQSAVARPARHSGDCGRIRGPLNPGRAAWSNRAWAGLAPAERIDWRMKMRRLALLVALWSRFKGEARMAWAMLRHPATPLVSKLVAVAAIAYLLSPFDLVTDFVPFVGWIDDGLVVAALLWLAYRFLPRELYDALRRASGANADAPIEGRAERVA